MSTDLYSDFGTIKVTSQGTVRVVTLSRPGAYNAVDRQMHGELSTLWSRLAQDGDARAVVITGEGKAFSSGGDMDLMRVMRHDIEQRRVLMDEARDIVVNAMQCPLPVVAAVNGPAVGLGCSIVLLSDLVIMHPKAYMADPHVSIGLVAGDGGAVMWPLLAGLASAKEFLFTGDRLYGEEAVRTGVATRVSDEPLATALKLATRLAAQPHEALAATKRAINMHASHAVQTVLPYGLEAETASFDSTEHADALAAIARRKS